MIANSAALNIRSDSKSSYSSSSGLPPSRNKNPWLDEVLIKAVKNRKKIDEAINYYSEETYKKYANFKTQGQETALHAATRTFQFDLILRFVVLGANIYSTDSKGNTALYVAAE